MHPCFNNNHFKFVAEREDQDGELVTTYSLNLARLYVPVHRSGAGHGRAAGAASLFPPSAERDLRRGFAQGFVLNGMEECAFPPGHPQGSSELSWGGNYSEFPPVLAARMVAAG